MPKPQSRRPAYKAMIVAPQPEATETWIYLFEPRTLKNLWPS